MMLALHEVFNVLHEVFPFNMNTIQMYSCYSDVLRFAEHSIASLAAGLMQWEDDVWQELPKAFGSQGGYKTSSPEVTEFPQAISKPCAH